jgi:hypothetical protein
LRAQRLEAAFGDDEGALPIVAAIEHHEEAPRLDTAEHRGPVAFPLGKPEPKHVHRRAEILALEPGERAQRRVPAVGGDDKGGADFEQPLWRFGLDTRDRRAVHQEAVGLGLHAQAKARIAFALTREEIEKVPLRHEGDEAATSGKMGEIGEYDLLVADDAGDLVHLLVRQL